MPTPLILAARQALLHFETAAGAAWELTIIPVAYYLLFGEHMSSTDMSQSPGSAIKLNAQQVLIGGARKDLIATIKNTWLAKLYMSTLRKYPCFKALDIFIWQWGGARCLLPIYKRLSLRLALKKYPYGSLLTSFSDKSDSCLVSTETIVEPQRTQVEAPKIYSDRSYNLAQPFLLEYQFPPIHVHVVDEAWVYGGSNLIFTTQSVFCHDLYDFSRDYTSEELHGRHFYSKKKNSVYVLLRDPTPLTIPFAAACLDACAQNYAHFLTEVLPRITLFCSLEQYSSIPLIIDANLHNNLLEAIAGVVGPSRVVYLLPIGRAIKCGLLLSISATGYVPFDQRNYRLINFRQGQFCAHALKRVKDNVSLESLNKSPKLDYPEKIFVQRESSVRRLVNSQQIEHLLTQHGFSLIDTGKLNFHEQVALFSQAKVIIGPTGAAMANAMFCQPGTEIGILMATHKHMIYNYWPSMLSPLKIRVSYLLGRIVANRSRGIHGDFFVAESSINEFITEIDRSFH